MCMGGMKIAIIQLINELLHNTFVYLAHKTLNVHIESGAVFSMCTNLS